MPVGPTEGPTVGLTWHVYVELAPDQPVPVLALRRSRTMGPTVVFSSFMDESDAALQAQNLRKLGYDARHGESTNGLASGGPHGEY